MSLRFFPTLASLSPAGCPAASIDDSLCSLLLQASPMAFFDYDKQTDQLLLSLPGTEDDDRITRSMPDFRLTFPANPITPFKLRDDLQKSFEHYCASPVKESASLCLDLYGKGDYRWYLGFIYSQAEPDGDVHHVLGYLRDVQTERVGELRLEKNNIYQRAVDFVSLFVYEFDLPDYAPRDVGQHPSNDYFQLSSYLSPQSEALIHPDDLMIFRTLTHQKSLLASYHAQQYELRATLRLKTRNDDWHWVQFTVHLSHGGSLHQAHGIGYVQLIHSQKLLEERAELDAVTGLLNRATLEERIRLVLHESLDICHFFIFDIDSFKSVNDTNGHAEGDRALRMIADIMRRYTRKEDLLGRIGGDEFVALIRGLPSDEAALSRAEEILCAVRALKCPAEWQGIRLSLSVGLAASVPGESSYETLYRAADQSLYRAKGLGKDRCCTNWA